MAVRENLVEMCKKISSGHYEITPECAEYRLFENWITDDQIRVMMAMDLMVPTTAEEVAETAGMTPIEAYKALMGLADVSCIAHATVYGMEMFMQVFYAPGIWEFMTLDDPNCQKHPEIPFTFRDHATKSMENYADRTPMGAGIMRVIPIESSVPAETKILDSESATKLIMDNKDSIAILPCQCRRVRRYTNEGAGDLEGEGNLETGMCMYFSLPAQHFIQNGLGHAITAEEALEKLKYFEEIGCVHQITTLKEGETVGMCNCMPGTCQALGVSSYFNTPEFSRSNFVAEVSPDNCVACGACVEYCANNAVKLGQKLCTKTPIEVPETESPIDTEWGPEKWNPNYRENRENTMPTGTSPCKTACPAHIAVQGYIKKASEGKYLEALEVIKRENPFPAVCGRICPHNCENECTRGSFDEAVSIDEIKKFIADKELDGDFTFVPKKYHDYGKKIAIIGSGPAGLSCAYYLARDGYRVTVFEKQRRVGGMLTLGIPNFRLEKGVVDAEIDVLRRMNVEFKTGVEVGRDVTIPQLRVQGFEAFYVAIGAQGGRKLNVPGEDAEGVIAGVDFLRDVALTGRPALEGKVVVIGGGNVAIDVARTAVRKGADHTAMYCLESVSEMPALPEEQEEAKGEGIEINNGWGPKEFEVTDGRVTGVVFKKCVSVFDEDHKFAPKYDENDTITVPADFVLVSVGQSIEWGRMLDGERVELGRGNTAQADGFTYQTAQPDIFVGGDVFSGPKFAIDAIAAGKQGAVSIHRFVWPGQSLTMGRDRRHFTALDKDNLDRAEIEKGFDNTPRQRPLRDETKAMTSGDDRLTFTEEQLKKEAARCLGCGAAHVDTVKCFGCGVCAQMCKFDAIHLTRKSSAESIAFTDRHEAFAKYAELRRENIRIKRDAHKA